MKHLIALGWPRSPKLSFALFISVVQGLSAIALLATSAWLLARAAEMPSMMYLSLAIVGVRTFALARASLRYAERWLSHDAVLKDQGELRGVIYRSLITRVPGKLQMNIGELSARVISDVDEIPNLALRVALPLIQSVSVSVLSVILFAVILPAAAVPLALALATVYVISLPVASMISRAADRNSASDRGELTAAIRSAVAAAPLIESFGWQHDMQSAIAAKQQTIAAANSKVARAFGAGQAAFGFLAQASAALAAVLGLQQLQEAHSKSLVMLAVYALVPLGVFDVASGGSGVVSVWRRYRAAAERIQEFMPDSAAQRVSAPAVQMPRVESLQLRGASLGYSGSILEGVDLELNQGRVTALVGPSGSGKTTIGLALTAFIEPTAGHLLVNGKPLSSFAASADQAAEALRTRVGYLEQQPSILAGNVRQNLLLARPGATDEELIGMLKQVQLWSMFEAREGLATELGERGVLVSGGEAQRLSLARALLADFDFIVLDEPTANLSHAQSMQLVSDLLHLARSRGKGVLLITHQPELAQLADELYAIE